MPISSEVPTSYMSRWNASAPQPTPISSRDDNLSPSGSATFKYNTSCSKCRESRVKCSGGTPCQRCAASDNPSLCAYSVSRRRGKRKASDGPSELAAQVEAPVQPDVLDITALDPFVLHEWDVPDGIAWPDSDTAANSVSAHKGREARLSLTTLYVCRQATLCLSNQAPLATLAVLRAPLQLFRISLAPYLSRPHPLPLAQGNAGRAGNRATPPSTAQATS